MKGAWIVKGAGYGHGIGMSQYGAYGSAKAGKNHQQILAQYYSGTTLGTSPSDTIRVLLLPYQGTVRFGGRERGLRPGDQPRQGLRRGPLGRTPSLLRDTGGSPASPTAARC